MTQDTPTPDKKPIPGDRIAKVLARAGIASRRDAEGMIEEGRVSVNGRIIKSPAMNVMPKDRIMVDGHELREAEPPRVWLYHKPIGLVTTARDEKGRETVFDKLPKELPRVMSVGRLDINSEGLLLLTNDGELKRKLELPDTGWLRKYRVRVKGTLSEAILEPLRKGIEIEGERFQPMEVVFDRQQGANAWLTVGIREGKNREIRRAMEAVGLVVNRLIRISYGPFRLGNLLAGAVEEVRPRVLRDQLGVEGDGEGQEAPRREVSRGGKPGGPRTETTGRDPRGPKPPFKGKRDGDRGGDRGGDRPAFKGKRDGDDRPFSKGPRRDGDKPFSKGPRRDGDKPYDKGPRRDGDKPFAKGPRRDGDKPSGGGPRKDFGPSKGPRRDGDGKPGFKSQGYKSHGGKPGGGARSAGFKSHGAKPGGKPGGKKDR
ncbi:pseudouridine synthase [Celeribacter arenosi]|uniref:Pseudouridine synthase n=1 Tax=Celeribacter arenosi TaxID=792649 RepID=A0ABP7JT55_9RHOB